MKHNKEIISLNIVLVIILYFVVSFISILIGHYKISPSTLFKVLASKVLPIAKTWNTQVESVVFNIRLPRVISASIIGASLSVSGLVYQTVFRNPLVSPDLLGTTSASGFGAALAMVLTLQSSLISPIALIFGLLSLFLVYIVASKVKDEQILGLVLAGIMVSSIFQALTSLIKLIADPVNVLPSITYFLMGSLAGSSLKDFKILLPSFLIGIIPIILLSWRINILSLSEEEAKTIGINTRALRLIVITCSALMVASTVAVAGVIGWVGLVIPHIVRFLVGQDCRKTIPTSIFLGAAFLVATDTISRSISTTEVPIGILTALIGAPFFLYLIIRKSGRKEID